MARDKCPKCKIALEYSPTSGAYCPNCGKIYSEKVEMSKEARDHLERLKEIMNSD